MSEEFLRVARHEVIEDIAGIGNLLQDCKTDADVFSKTPDLEKYIHKIKGLAPMMNQEQIGNVAILLDKILKVMLSGKSVSGIYQTMNESCGFMKNAINGNTRGYDELTVKIQFVHKDLL